MFNFAKKGKKAAEALELQRADLLASKNSELEQLRADLLASKNLELEQLRADHLLASKNSELELRTDLASKTSELAAKDAALEVLRADLGSIDSVAVDLSSDEQVCVGLMRKHGVDSKKLTKLLDQSVNQAAALISEYERTGTLPAALAKAFLSGINSGTVAHLNERDQRTLQIPPLQALVDNAGYDEGQTPDHFIDDGYLGEGNGVQSRLTAIEARKS